MKAKILTSGTIPALCGLGIAATAVIQSRPWLAFMAFLLGIAAGMQLQTYVLPEHIQDQIWSSDP